MKRTQVALAIGLALSIPGTALAETVEERLDRLEAALNEQIRVNAAQDEVIKRQEATITEQKATIAEQSRKNEAQDTKLTKQERTISEQKAALEGTPQRVKKLAEAIEKKQAAETPADAWYNRIEVAGVVEVEYGYHDPFEGDSESAFSLATFELGVFAPITDWVEVGASLLYEQDDTPLEVDIAYATIGNLEENPLYATVGQIYVPFGAYETNMVSDPLTLELGETRETALQLGFVKDAFNGSVYVFNGDNESDNHVSSWGANLGFAQEAGNGVTWGGGIGYISDLGDSDAFQDLIADNLGSNDINKVPAWTINAAASFGGGFVVIGEYLAATKSFETDGVPWRMDGAKPTAWNVEVGYEFDIKELPSVFAVGYQGSSQALALELPKDRFITALGVEIFDSTTLAVEWAHDKDYSTSDGGTGNTANTFTAQLAVEF